MYDTKKSIVQNMALNTEGEKYHFVLENISCAVVNM